MYALPGLNFRYGLVVKKALVPTTRKVVFVKVFARLYTGFFSIVKVWGKSCATQGGPLEMNSRSFSSISAPYEGISWNVFSVHIFGI